MTPRLDLDLDPDFPECETRVLMALVSKQRLAHHVEKNPWQNLAWHKEEEKTTPHLLSVGMIPAFQMEENRLTRRTRRSAAAPHLEYLNVDAAPSMRTRFSL